VLALLTRKIVAAKKNGESEGGQKFLPPSPLPFCPPERKFIKSRRWDFLENEF
jgi:hypothetical protein